MNKSVLASAIFELNSIAETRELTTAEQTVKVLFRAALAKLVAAEQVQQSDPAGERWDAWYQSLSQDQIAEIYRKGFGFVEIETGDVLTAHPEFMTSFCDSIISNRNQATM